MDMNEIPISDLAVLPDAQGASAASNEHAAAHAELAPLKMRDVQLMLAAIWIEVANTSKEQIKRSQYCSTAREWEQLAERATARALDHMRAGLHKKKEAGK